jgi:hypothetical protein
LPQLKSHLARQATAAIWDTTKEFKAMVRRLLGLLIGATWMFAVVMTAYGARPADSLLPASTKGFVSIPSVRELLNQLDRSRIGQLVNDPLLQPFIEELKRQAHEQGLRQLEQLGLSVTELANMPTGEVALAAIQLSPDEYASALVVDVIGHSDQATALLNRVADRMTKNGAKRLRRADGDGIIVYQFPAEPGRRNAPCAAYLLDRDMLLASDNVSVLEGMRQALVGQRGNSLADVKAYREIMARCESAAGGLAPSMRWFIEPFGYAEIVRAATALRDRRTGPDLIKICKEQGFGAVQGIGGFVNLSTGKYEVLHRTMIYAPAPAGKGSQDKDRFAGAARMLRFPDGGDLLPQNWVPNNAATYTTFNWDMATAFSCAGPLADQMIGQKGVFRDILASLRDDPDGPRVDLEKDLIAHLGRRITVITDYELPIGPKSERKVIAIELKDEPEVAATMRKLMSAERDARPRDFDGHLIWELVDTHTEVPALVVEAPGATLQHSESDVNRPSPRNDRLLSTTAYCVADGNLFLASHIEFLQKVLRQAKSTRADGLAAADDFRQVALQQNVVAAGPISFRVFTRTDREVRDTYELIRTGQMPQSESVLGKILNSLLSDNKQGGLRKQKIDGHLLPEFDSIQHYFGPAGSFVTTLDDGWLCTGLMLASDTSVRTTGGDHLSPANVDDGQQKAELRQPNADVDGPQPEQVIMPAKPKQARFPHTRLR